MNVFFSWSGSTSREIAEVFNLWLPKVVQKVEPFFSPIDVAKGTRWQSEIASKLEGCSIGFLFMTKQNLAAPWIMFEAGALSKHIAESRICCLLFGIGVGDIKGPLEQFNHTMFEKDDFFKIVLMVNEVVPGRTLPREQMEAVFEQWWPELADKVQTILDKAKDATTDAPALPSRLSDADYFKEMNSLLEYMRTTARQMGGSKKIDVSALTKAEEEFLKERSFPLAAPQMMNETLFAELSKYSMLRSWKMRGGVLHIQAESDADSDDVQEMITRIRVFLDNYAWGKSIPIVTP